jgi:NAD(P)-dependent dehydrogenase (short-subunit alcohol dehydrogenase family)
MAAVYPDLEGKVALVTGGAAGIGESLVRELARQRAKVAFIDIAVEPARALVRDLERCGQSVRFEPCDLMDIPALQRTIQAVRGRLGPIQVLINNAGAALPITEPLTEKTWEQLFAANLKHQLFCSEAVFSDMKTQGAGVIINLGAISWMIGQGGLAAYNTAKSAVLGLTRSLARDYGPHGIRVNAVAPGWVESELANAQLPASEAEILERQCLKRRLKPVEVARFIVFLASEEASACTGQHYIVDAGYV